MNNINLFNKEIKAANGEKIKLVYDTNEDMLDIFFGENSPATGVELSDHILLRLNRATGKAVSLTIRHLSILTESTEYGICSYPLEKLEDLPNDLRELAIKVVTTEPINQFLKLSYFQASPNKRIPFIVDRYHFASAA